MIVSIFSLMVDKIIDHIFNYVLSLSGKCEKRVRDAQRKRGDKVLFNVLPAEFCAGGEIGHDSCKGDGGAPLVCEAKDGRWHVVGLGKYLLFLSSNILHIHSYKIFCS